MWKTKVVVFVDDLIIMTFSIQKIPFEKEAEWYVGN